jgi:inosine-uridine nucleoside N-ribohydrolase
LALPSDRGLLKNQAPTMDVLIDTDPGMGTLGSEPEDSLAVAMALVSPEVTVRAITCVQGNVPVRHSYANATYLLELLGRTDVPLAAGEERPLLGARRREQLRWLAERDAFDRVLPVAQPPFAEPRAVELILRTARASDGLTIVAIGPLTNLAAALVADPFLADRLEAVVVMGGAFEVPGNITPTAEFNFFMDPEAAQIVLESGVQPVLVGLDVCHQTHLTNRQIAATGFNTEFGRFVQCACESWLPAVEASEDEGPNLYDTLAVACAFRPELLTVEPAFVQIETASEAGAGASMAWLPGRWSVWSRPNGADNALVATGVDVAGFEALFTERVLAQL